MASRLLVQVGMIIIITTAVFVIGKDYDKITLTPAGYVVTYFTAIICGTVSLSLGQLVVGFIKNPETVNSTTRLVYLALILVGIFGEVNHALNQAMHHAPSQLDQLMYQAVQWSPYGAVKTILSTGMAPSGWSTDTTTALLVTLAYTVVFTVVGIKWFKWNTK
jgi:ABC-2 type transport system permease protein